MVSMDVDRMVTHSYSVTGVEVMKSMTEQTTPWKNACHAAVWKENGDLLCSGTQLYANIYGLKD